MRYRAVFFDVGGTLVEAAPSFPELFADVVTSAGHPVTAAAVRDASEAVTEGFSRAARENRLWTTSPERSRAFWGSIYDLMLGALDLPTEDGLRETLYRAFTDRSNYALYERRGSRPLAARRRRVPLGDRVELRGLARRPPRRPSTSATCSTYG